MDIQDHDYTYMYNKGKDLVHSIEQELANSIIYVEFNAHSPKSKTDELERIELKPYLKNNYGMIIFWDASVSTSRTWTTIVTKYDVEFKESAQKQECENDEVLEDLGLLSIYHKVESR